MSKDIIFDEEYITESYPVTPDVVSKAIQECKNDILAPFTNFSNILSPDIPKRLEEVFTPVIFRKPISFYSPHRLMKTQPCASQRLNNLSFSQPSTPKTPALTGPAQPTPLRSTFEAMVLTTPMLIKTLDNLQQQTVTGSQSLYPDILQLIDDDSCSGTVLDQHIECNETNITDSNIVDYLLDLSQDGKHQALFNESTITTTGLQSQGTACESPPRIFQKTRRKTKLMTEQERQSLQRIKYEKQKLHQKEKFSKMQRNGTRKHAKYLVVSSQKLQRSGEELKLLECKKSELEIIVWTNFVTDSTK